MSNNPDSKLIMTDIVDMTLTISNMDAFGEDIQSSFHALVDYDI